MCRLRLSFAGAGQAAGVPSDSPRRVLIGPQSLAHNHWPQSLAKAPAIDHDTHACIAAARTHRRRHVRAGVIRIVLGVDLPAVLRERADAVILIRAVLAVRAVA